MTDVTFQLNGAEVHAQVEPRTSLADYLRRQELLTAAHLGCEHGVCGACTVMVDGATARSCILFAASLEGAEVRTLEGFAGDPLMDRMKHAFHTEHALQCGFCTPGMLITARDIAVRFDALEDKQLRVELSGNLCRCTGYAGVVRAVQMVMKEVPSGVRADMRPRLANAAPAVAVPAVAVMPLAPHAHAPLLMSVDSDTAGWVLVEETLEVGLPCADVWAMLADPAAVAGCLPGFDLETATADSVRGRMRLALGPIKTSFAVHGAIARDEAQMTGVLTGAGQDDRGSSRAKGRVTYALNESAPGATLLKVKLEYQLQGPLAQFSRSNLMRDFTSRLLQAFARNLAHSARSGAAVAAAPDLGLVSMMWSVLRARLLNLLPRTLRGRAKK